MRRPAKTSLYCGLLSSIAILPSLGQEAASKPKDEKSTLPRVTITGDPLTESQTPGSATAVTAAQIQNQTYANPNRVFQQIPGVYVRDEDGYGNFPNISLRGTDSVRSAKVTIMEDGIPMSPAPYSFPADYHFPRVGRMSGVEVFKGSTQIRYGPHTTGGAINFLATPFVSLGSADSASAGYLKSTYGSYNTFLNHGWWGHTEHTKAGKFGVLIEMFHNQSDGFRNIDKAPDRTGFLLLEPMIRAFWEPDTNLKQRLELRFGYSDFSADETHLGVTDADLRADPLRRYASTQFDKYTSSQYRYSLRHIMEPSDSVRVETTGYYTYFRRDWYKLTDIRTPGGVNIPIATALATPGEPLDILRGDAAGSWRIRSNDRNYDTLGIQSQADWKFATGQLEHQLTAGMRLHYDDAVRFERDDRATIDATGNIVSFVRGLQGGAGNRIENVVAYSMFAEDKIQYGRLTVKPGLRWEHMQMEYQDRATSGPDLRQVIASASGAQDALAPGVAMDLGFNDHFGIFGSYYRGISNPAPRERLRGKADMETTDGFEFGVRHQDGQFKAQVAGFYTEFNNMIANDGLGGLGTIDDSNAGDARLYGVEGSVRWDALKAKDANSDWGLPLRASGTFTHSEFIRGNPIALPSSIYAGAQPGNQLPYVPEFAASAGIGLEHSKFGVYLDATYLDSMFGSASNATNLIDPNGNPDARYGKTESAIIVDLSGNYQVTQTLRLLAGIGNLTDESYITSRLPSGARANQPRTFYGGLQVRF